MSNKVSIFFKTDCLVQVDVDTENQKEIDALAWKAFADTVLKLPDNIAVGEAKIQFIAPGKEELKDALSKIIESNTEAATGQYL